MKINDKFGVNDSFTKVDCDESASKRVHQLGIAQLGVVQPQEQIAVEARHVDGLSDARRG